MKKRSFAVCEIEGCQDAVILDSTKGVIINGGVYAADPENPQLLAGGEGDAQVALCQKHTLEALGWTDADAPKASPKSATLLDNLTEENKKLHLDNDQLIEKLDLAEAALEKLEAQRNQLQAKYDKAEQAILERETSIMELRKQLETSEEPKPAAKKSRKLKPAAEPVTQPVDDGFSELPGTVADQADDVSNAFGEPVLASTEVPPPVLDLGEKPEASDDWDF